MMNDETLCKKLEQVFLQYDAGIFLARKLATLLTQFELRSQINPHYIGLAG